MMCVFSPVITLTSMKWDTLLMFSNVRLTIPDISFKLYVGSNSVANNWIFLLLLYTYCYQYFRIHRHADSLFSTSSGFADFRGFFNLAVLLLVSK